MNINLSSSAERAEADTGSSQQQPPPPPPVIVLSSTGPTAERHGGSLGVFEYLEQYNNSPAYRQRHTATLAGKPLYLYRAEPGIWCVGRELGGASVGLVNKTNSSSVPTDNWLCSTEYSWQPDPQMSVTTSLSSVCGLISITLLGAAARVQPETGGEYRATGAWSGGRPVF